MNEDINKIWALFIEKCALNSFGEREIIMEGKKMRNFLGSVEAHKLIFDEAVSEILEKRIK